MESLSHPLFPAVVGILVILMSGVIAAVKGYRWLVGQIREAIKDAMDHHQEVESGWQREIERRLENIEHKLDRLSGEK